MAKAALCPVCRKHPAEPDYRPVCSRRCADVDLQGWLSGRYAIPAVDDESEDRTGSAED